MVLECLTQVFAVLFNRAENEQLTNCSSDQYFVEFWVNFNRSAVQNE